MSSQKTNRKKNSQSLRKPYTLVALAGGFILVFLIIASVFLLNGNDPTVQALPAEISVQDAFAKRQAGAFVLDVRTPEEWNEFHVPESTLIPLNELASRLDDVPEDREVVVVCRSGNRSQQGRDILLNAGFTSVTSMAGGLRQWQSTGYPTVPGP